MSRGINKVILIGNLGADPEIRYTLAGDAVATLRLATGESWKDRQTGEIVERTEWHRVILWRRLAEIAEQYLRKGSRIYIEGKLNTRKWQDSNGQDRYTTEIQANEMQMLDGRSEYGEQTPRTVASDATAHAQIPDRNGAGTQAPREPEPAFADDISF